MKNNNIKSYSEFKDTSKTHDSIKFYHGTCKNSADNIIRNGWKPYSGYIGSNNGQNKYLYLTTEIEDALWFAEEKGCDTIIEVIIEDYDYILPDSEEVGYTKNELIDRALNTLMPSKFVLYKELPKEKFKIVNHNLTESFRRKFKKIYDAFNIPVEIDFQETLLGYRGEFVVNNNNYKINSNFVKHNFLTFKFSRYDNYKNEYTQELFNDKSKFRVIPTIQTAISYIIDKSESGVIFTALDKSIGRKNLYKKFCIEFCESNNLYTHYIFGYDNITLYMIYRKDKNFSNSDLLDVIEDSKKYISTI